MGGEYLYSALQMALEAQTRAVALAALVGIAELLKWEGQSERAIELLTLVLRHAASEQETKDRAQVLLEELKPQLPGQVFAAAQRRGKAGELERVSAEILAEPERLHN